MHERPHTPNRPLLRTYGRRRGKRLSQRKERLIAELLPDLRPDLEAAAPDNVSALLPVPVREVWLEIGFGAGEHLLWHAGRHRDIGLIGCEPFINGVASLLGAIEDRGLQNILIHDGDARDVLAWLPAASIARALILFPDPWPKKRQAKRRLLSPEFVSSLARAVRQGGELRFASDDMDYVCDTLLAVSRSAAFSWQAERAADWRMRPEGWPETRYERKALHGGRKPAYLRWVRV